MNVSIPRLRPVLIALLFGLLLTACESRPVYPAVPAGATVLAVGDSVTYGTGAGPGEDYPTRLARLSGWRVVNAGIPGDTAQAARRRVEAVLRETEPALVIVELGGNDFLRRRSETLVKEDLRAILGAVKESGAQSVLVAVPRVSMVGVMAGALPDSAIYRELAEEEQVPLVEKVFAKILSDASLRADRVHPNAEGYRAMADGIATALATFGLLAAP